MRCRKLFISQDLSCRCFACDGARPDGGRLTVARRGGHGARAAPPAHLERRQGEERRICRGWLGASRSSSDHLACCREARFDGPPRLADRSAGARLSLLPCRSAALAWLGCLSSMFGALLVGRNGASCLESQAVVFRIKSRLILHRLCCF